MLSAVEVYGRRNVYVLDVVVTVSLVPAMLPLKLRFSTPPTYEMPSRLLLELNPTGDRC